MIKNLHIENIGSHEDTMFNFHPGINIILGEGCNGKTYGIVRPFKLLRYFRPINFKFHSHFSKEKFTKISTTVINDNKEYVVSLERYKDPKKSKYEITLPNSKKEQFRRFNKQVPQMVVDILNLNELNFQYQLDTPYIISETPGKITKIINSVTKIDDVDQWVKKLNSKIRSYENDIKTQKEELKDIKSELKKLPNLSKIKIKLKELKRLENKISKLELEYDEIEDLFSEIDNDQKEINRLKKLLKSEKKYNKLNKIKKDINNLEDLIYEIEEYIDIQNKLIELNNKKEKTKELYIKSLKDNGKCPTCFNKIDNKAIRRIKNEL